MSAVTDFALGNAPRWSFDRTDVDRYARSIIEQMDAEEALWPEELRRSVRRDRSRWVTPSQFERIRKVTSAPVRTLDRERGAKAMDYGGVTWETHDVSWERSVA